ncbi:hypothetical protein [Micromonospora sp. NPDC023633]|uniref:hypothetical protein n=1 Tax=Micromonospora sp. NPDC023633 TaxID=3154320 RepID=UPI0033C8A5B7
MRRTLHLPAALLLVAVLAGCGSDSEPAAAPPTSAPAATSAAPSPSPSSASPTPAAPKPPVDGGKYESPLLLVEALGEGGIDCTGYEAVASPTGAIARGSCYVAGEEYTIGIYKSATQARQQPNALAKLLKGVADMDLVLGRNWTVGCPDQPSCREVAAVLGGEVFHEAA